MIVCFDVLRIVLMMDREERSVICTFSANLSSQNSVLGITTAFSKGRQTGATAAGPEGQQKVNRSKESDRL